MKNDFFRKSGIKPADCILIAALFLLSFMVFLPFSGTQKADTVAVTQGENCTRYSLSENREIELDCGGIILIRDGKVTATNMPCPDKICEKSGPISAQGESMVCLPNQVAVKIDAKTDSKLDGVSQ